MFYLGEGMVDSINNSLAANNDVNYLNYTNVDSDDNYDTSIFNNIELLNEQLALVQEEQGCFSKMWDGFKNTTGLGLSSDDCEDAIEKYKKGEISFEEASQEIEKFKEKQSSSLDLFSNIATGAAAIGAATLVVATGGAALPMMLAVGAGTGAVVKTGMKLTDRATNEVEGDALDAKQIAKDSLQGALTGSISAATMGTGSASTTLGKSIAKSSIRSAKTGLITGSISGASNYTLDCAFDENKDFKTSEMLKSAAINGACTATVGAVIGGTNGALRYNGVLKSGGMVQNSTDGIKNATAKDIAANSACSTSYKIGNNKIHELIN